MSSAKPITFASSGTLNLRMSSYMMFHSKKPNTEPCGTPPVTLYSLGPLSMLYLRTLRLKQSATILLMYIGTLSFWRASWIHLHLAELNAFLMSKVIIAQYFLDPLFHRLSSIAFRAVLTTTLIASTVERLFLKPYNVIISNIFCKCKFLKLFSCNWRLVFYLDFMSQVIVFF